MWDRDADGHTTEGQTSVSEVVNEDQPFSLVDHLPTRKQELEPLLNEATSKTCKKDGLKMHSSAWYKRPSAHFRIPVASDVAEGTKPQPSSERTSNRSSTHTQHDKSEIELNVVEHVESPADLQSLHFDPVMYIDAGQTTPESLSHLSQGYDWLRLLAEGQEEDSSPKYSSCDGDTDTMTGERQSSLDRTFANDPLTSQVTCNSDSLQNKNSLVNFAVVRKWMTRISTNVFIFEAMLRDSPVDWWKVRAWYSLPCVSFISPI